MALAKTKKTKEKVVVTAAKYNTLKKDYEELEDDRTNLVVKCLETNLELTGLREEHELLKSKHILAGQLHNTLTNLRKERAEVADAEIAQLTEDLKVAYEMTRSLLNRAR